MLSTACAEVCSNKVALLMNSKNLGGQHYWAIKLQNGVQDGLGWREYQGVKQVTFSSNRRTVLCILVFYSLSTRMHCRSSSTSKHHWMYCWELEHNEMQLGAGLSRHWNCHDSRAWLAHCVSICCWRMCYRCSANFWTDTANVLCPVPTYSIETEVIWSVAVLLSL